LELTKGAGPPFSELWIDQVSPPSVVAFNPSPVISQTPPPCVMTSIAELLRYPLSGDGKAAGKSSWAEDVAAVNRLTKTKSHKSRIFFNLTTFSHLQNSRRHQAGPECSGGILDVLYDQNPISDWGVSISCLYQRPDNSIYHQGRQDKSERRVLIQLLYQPAPNPFRIRPN